MRIYATACVLLLVSVVSISTRAQKISGRVLSESGRGASHVTVHFNNQSYAVMTNTDGTFTITAKKLPDTLVFSAAGYETYKVVVTEETLKDTHFEIVLLSTRSKAPVAEVVSAEYSPPKIRREETYSEDRKISRVSRDGIVSANISASRKRITFWPSLVLAPLFQGLHALINARISCARITSHRMLTSLAVCLL